jgi:hypothetical protein
MNSTINSKAQLLLALLHANYDDDTTVINEIEGITRLEKLIFLAQKEEKITIENEGKKDNFDFIPFKMGPWSSDVYDEVDFLESMGLLEKRGTQENEPVNQAHDEMLFNEAILDKYQKSYPTLDNEMESYRLTVKGIEIAKKLWERLDNDECEKLKKIKKKFNKMNLKQLLRYVYTKYPDYTSESEIKDYIFN